MIFQRNIQPILAVFVIQKLHCACRKHLIVSYLQIVPNSSGITIPNHMKTPIENPYLLMHSMQFMNLFLKLHITEFNTESYHLRVHLRYRKSTPRRISSVTNSFNRNSDYQEYGCNNETFSVSILSCIQ